VDREQTIRDSVLLNLVEEFLSRFADALQPLDLSQSKIRLSDKPTVRCDLVLDEIVFRSGAANVPSLSGFGLP
jgi:hypothetical protein